MLQRISFMGDSGIPTVGGISAAEILAALPGALVRAWKF
jgi:hypothetical protein